MMFVSNSKNCWLFGYKYLHINTVHICTLLQKHKNTEIIFKKKKKFNPAIWWFGTFISFQVEYLNGVCQLLFSGYPAHKHN